MIADQRAASVSLAEFSCFRQDAGRTLRFEDSLLSFFRMHWDHDPVCGSPLVWSPAFRRSDRLKPGPRTVGSWKAATLLRARIGTTKPTYSVSPPKGPGVSHDDYEKIRRSHF